MFVACPSLKQEASTRVHTSESLVWRFLELLIVMAAETPRRRPSHSRRIPVQKTLFGAPVTGQSFCGEAWSKRETQALVDHVMLMGDVTLVQSGAVSIRTKYHNVPVELPPPPTMQIHMAEHSIISKLSVSIKHLKLYNCESMK